MTGQADVMVIAGGSGVTSWLNSPRIGRGDFQKLGDLEADLLSRKGDLKQFSIIMIGSFAVRANPILFFFA